MRSIQWWGYPPAITPLTVAHIGTMPQANAVVFFLTPSLSERRYQRNRKGSVQSLERSDLRFGLRACGLAGGVNTVEGETLTRGEN